MSFPEFVLFVNFPVLFVSYPIAPYLHLAAAFKFAHCVWLQFVDSSEFRYTSERIFQRVLGLIMLFDMIHKEIYLPDAILCLLSFLILILNIKIFFEAQQPLIGLGRLVVGVTHN